MIYDKPIDKLRVPGFVFKYVENKITNDSKIKLNNMMVNYYNKIIEDSIRDDKFGADLLLINYEDTIIDCLDSIILNNNYDDNTTKH